MNATVADCIQCHASMALHDPYGFCPDEISPVGVSVGVTIRKWAIPAAAVVLASASLFAGGYVIGHTATRSCTYGSQRLRNGQIAPSSDPGIDGKCDNGTMVQYVPPAKPWPTPSVA
jgi:hypothetical protein